MEVYSCLKPAYICLEFKIGRRGVVGGNKYKLSCKDIFFSESLSMEAILYQDSKTGVLQEKIGEINLYFLSKGGVRVFGGQIRFDLAKLLSPLIKAKYVCQELTKTTELNGRLVFEMTGKKLLVETPHSPIPSEKTILYRSVTPDQISSRFTKPTKNSENQTFFKPKFESNSSKLTSDSSEIKGIKEENESLKAYISQLEQEIRNKNIYYKKMKEENNDKTNRLVGELEDLRKQLEGKNKELEERQSEIFNEFRVAAEFVNEDDEQPRTYPFDPFSNSKSIKQKEQELSQNFQKRNKNFKSKNENFSQSIHSDSQDILGSIDSDEEEFIRGNKRINIMKHQEIENVFPPIKTEKEVAIPIEYNEVSPNKLNNKFETKEEDELSRMKEELNLKKMSLFKNSEQIKKLESENTKLHSHIESFTLELQKVRNELHESQSKAGNLSSQLSFANARIKGAESEVIESKERLASIVNMIFESGNSELLDEVMTKFSN